MIAYAGYLRLKTGQIEDLNFQAKPRWPMDELSEDGLSKNELSMDDMEKV
jgi:tRNA A37 threonylcarbamoyltransferase TsaD